MSNLKFKTGLESDKSKKGKIDGDSFQPKPLQLLGSVFSNIYKYTKKSH